MKGTDGYMTSSQEHTLCCGAQANTYITKYDN